MAAGMIGKERKRGKVLRVRPGVENKSTGSATSAVEQWPMGGRAELHSPESKLTGNALIG